MKKLKKVILIHGDITDFSVDAIVNSANKSLLGGGGLDYIIHKKAGYLMKEACIHLNKTKGGCQTGDAEVTIAGDLPAKFIIHAVAPRWLNGEKNEPQLLCNAYNNVLLKAEEIKAQTVAIPTMGTGVYNFPKQLAAEIAIGTILSQLHLYKEIEEIYFFCKDDDNLMIYKNILTYINDPNIEINI